MAIGRLDYAPEKLAPFGREYLLLEANNDIERSMRLSACAKEPWTVAFIEALAPGKTFWDIGACVGSYTLIAAARGLDVVAFEPVAENCATLVRNLALNELLDRVLVLPFPLGDQNALIWQHRSDMRSGAASHVLSGSPRKRGLHQQLLGLVTADMVLNLWGLPIPKAIKIDVDGFELQVLQGAEKLLENPGVSALLVEMQTANDQPIVSWLAARRWVVSERYPERGGIYYAKYERVT